MSALNSVQMVGRLTSDVEVRHFDSGKSVGRFSIAVDRWNGTETVVDFFNLELWNPGKREGWMLTGKQVSIQGELRQSRWSDDSGNHSRIFVHVSDIAPLASPKNRKEESAVESKVETAEEQLVDF